MPDLSVARHLPGTRLPQALSRGEGSGGEGTRPDWWPIWSVPAGLRALRAVLVIPSLLDERAQSAEEGQAGDAGAVGQYAPCP